MAPDPCTVVIHTDASPFILFSRFLNRLLKVRNSTIDLSHLPDELARIETDNGTARAGELRITMYPSDSLLRFAAAACARNGNRSSVEDCFHG